MLNVRLAGDHLYGKWLTVHLAVACDVFDDVFLCCPFPHEINNQAIRLSQNIYDITNIFKTNNYRFENGKDNHFTNYLLEFIHSVTVNYY